MRHKPSCRIDLYLRRVSSLRNGIVTSDCADYGVTHFTFLRGSFDIQGDVLRYTSRRLLSTSVAALLAVTVLASCGDNGSSNTAAGNDAPSASGIIGLLLPGEKTARYEAADRPDFEAKVKELCAECKVNYLNANKSAETQFTQAKTTIANGAKVLVLDPVDYVAAASIVTAAKAANVKVISYDRLVNGAPDYYVSFDNEKVGQLQGEALIEGMTKVGVTGKPTIIMINGSPTDPNSAQFKKGAHSVLDNRVIIAREYDTPDWSPEQARTEMEQAITALGKGAIDGVYAANDATAGGAFAAMTAAGFAIIPPMTGQDSEVESVQRILAGQQYMTIYKPIKPEAENAASLAVQLIQGKTPNIDGVTFTPINNGTIDVQSIILTPIKVTKDNVKSTVVADGFLTVADICTLRYLSACKSAEIN